ncbi:MAG: hypothetical protein PHF86_11590 [Candidatus Nanoarchaeia archaeon]|nr:hypothetical protein [Candidatus Nanoarchaeia archaeon]
MESFLKEALDTRKKLIGNRKKFWIKNKKDFEKNINKIINHFNLPKGWKVYVLIGNLSSDKKIMPYDYNSWSTTNLVAATKKQGYEIMIFFNRARSEFLSLTALLPIVIHEIRHVQQIAISPKLFLKSMLQDNLSKELEEDAEKYKRNLSDEFRKQASLEMILYCYDLGKWEKAQKMADFLFKEQEDIYGGGYDKEMTEREYNMFLEAKSRKNIKLFIEFFLNKPPKVI